jgi:hypothetical protein
MKLFPRLLPVTLLLAALSPAFSQVSPAARSGGVSTIPLVVGAGYSNFTMDWGPGHRSSGITAWADLYPFPGIVKDLGIEAEGRTSQWGNPIAHLREDTFQGGLIYSYSRFSKIRPYAKGLAGIGSMDFPPFPVTPNYKHDTFTVNSISGGADFQAWQNLWLRADYQYQWWHSVFGGTFTPNGITVGAHWDFRYSNPKY